MSRLAIAIGNTHIKVAWFEQSNLVQTWQVRHHNLAELVNILADQNFEQIAIASVVNSVITPWHNLAQTQLVSLDQIGLKNTYPSLGIDRALAAWGGGVVYGFPLLVVDLGTAISFSAVDQNQSFRGGAILAGVRSQLESLHNQTAALPLVEMSQTNWAKSLSSNKSRWANNTEAAIFNGVIYGIAGAIESFGQDWRSQYPDSKILLTGGDSALIYQFLSSDWQKEVAQDPNLIFWGINTTCFSDHE